MIDIRRYVKTHGELNFKPPMLTVIESSGSPTWKGLVSPHLQGYLHVTWQFLTLETWNSLEKAHTDGAVNRRPIRSPDAKRWIIVEGKFGSAIVKQPV
jgi:hypothetical protein